MDNISIGEKNSAKFPTYLSYESLNAAANASNPNYMSGDGWIWAKNPDNAGRNMWIGSIQFFMDGSYGNEENIILPIKKGEKVYFDYGVTYCRRLYTF